MILCMNVLTAIKTQRVFDDPVSIDVVVYKVHMISADMINIRYPDHTSRILYQQVAYRNTIVPMHGFLIRSYIK